MARIIVNLAADCDIDDILQEIGKSSGRAAATRFDRRLDTLLVRLMTFPESGAPRPKLGAGVRIGVVRPYLIVYRFVEATDLVEGLRVLHGRRNIRPRLLPP